MNRPLVDDPAAEERDRIFDQLELLSEMGRDFASSLDIQESLERAVDHITDYVEAEGGALFLLEDEGASLCCHACVGATEITGLTLPSDQGIVGRCVQSNTAEIVRDVQNDPNFYGKVDEKTGYTTRSILCAPLSVKDEKIGAVELINKRGGDRLFDEPDLHLLETMSASAALAIHNARMAEALVEQERLARELELAAEIQRSLLPQPASDEYPVSGVNVPARTVSGDFYDFFELEDGRICFNLGDVSGKGMNAALLMAKTASLFRCLGKTILDPGLLLARVNEEICETATRGMFVTMVGGIYDPKTGVVRFANAGHEPPQFLTPSGTFEDFPAEAPPLGISPFLVEDGRYPEESLNLEGGAFYVFTDGVTEGYLPDGSELGVDGLKEILTDRAVTPLLQRLEQVVSPIAGGGKLRDDITILAVDDRGPGDGRAPEIQNLRLAEPGDEDMETLLTLEIASRPDRLKLVRNAVSQAAAICGFSAETSRDIVIAVDEALQNVIRHAYENDPNGEIAITLARRDDRFIVLIRDFADRIDVSKVQPRDLDDVRPGGLGTHFIREVMDRVDFLAPPEDRGNLLRLERRIDER